MDPKAVAQAVDALTQRKYPLVEDIEGRVYFDVKGASARQVALLSLWHKHPGRMTEADIVAAIMRHGFTAHNARQAILRIAAQVDRNDHGALRLRQPGMVEAEALLARARLKADK